MRQPPSIAPTLPDHLDVYLVLNDFGGKFGRAWSETDEERTDREMVIADLLTGQYSDPVRVVVFNTAERWSRDVSEGDRRRAAAAPGRRGPRSSCQPRGIRRPASQRPAGAVAAAATGRGLDSQFRDEILIFRPMLKRFEFCLPPRQVRSRRRRLVPRGQIQRLPPSHRA